MKLLVRIAVVALVSLLARPLFAQTVGLADDARAGFISAGGYVGLEFDNADHALLLGADARVKLSNANLEVVPRFTYRPFDDGSMQQVDVNVLTNYKLANPGRFRPYSGLGISLQRYMFDVLPTETELGINLVTGVRLAMRPGAAYEPFLQAQYSIFKEPGNSFTLVVGTSFSFR